MSRRGRAVLLAVLALVLGALAAADVAGREAALDRRIGAPVPVVVAGADIPRGAALRPAVLAVRLVPARYAPVASFGRAADLGARRAAVALPRGTAIVAAMLDTGEDATPAGAASTPLLRPGERVAELVARGSADLVAAGSRVDVLVTRERASGAGATTLALEDAEVLAAEPADDGPGADGGPRVRVSLRVSVRQAVALAADQNFAREIRILPRAPGDRRRGLTGLRVAAG